MNTKPRPQCFVELTVPIDIIGPNVLNRLYFFRIQP